MYTGTLLELLEDKPGRKNRLTAFSFWDGEKPLWLRGNLSFKALKKEARAMSSAFYSIGLVPGDRIILMLGNTRQFPVVYFGALYLGLRVVPINPLLGTEHIEAIVKSSGARVVVAVDALCGKLQEIKKRTNLQKIILTGIDESLPALKAFVYNRRQKKAGTLFRYPRDDKDLFNLSELCRRKYSGPPAINILPEDIAVILYTSGTSGEPKGVVLSHKALMVNADACKKLLLDDLGIAMRPVLIAAAPFFHIMGISTMLHMALLMDAHVILVAERNPRNLIVKILSAASYTKATAFVGAPMHYAALAKNLMRDGRKYDLSYLQVCVSGSARLPDETRKQFEKLWGGKILEGYGMSEGGIFSCQRPYALKKGSVGRALNGVLIEVGAPDENGTGEILVKTPGLMLGYWGAVGGTDFAKTKSTIQNGRLHTGDMGRIDGDGDIFLSDRADDMIKLSSGEKISALEIEKEILKHPLIEEVAVVQIIRATGKDCIKAFIVLREETAENGITASEFLIYFRKHLRNEHIPDACEILSELPKNAFGKILKRTLRENKN